MIREYCFMCNCYTLCDCIDESYLKCMVCGNEFYNEKLINSNFDIININEIKEILNKYSIGKKPLSSVLGWGEVTIIRYLNGIKPDKYHSDILKELNNNYNLMLYYLNLNKDKITSIAYKKVIASIKNIQLEEENSKIYRISKYIVNNSFDITPLALQKLLYFIQGFSISLFGKPIFNDLCEAWVHGPVYRDIYDRFSNFGYNKIDCNFNFKLDLNKEEKLLIDCIIKYFGCYSGKILEEFTHISDPWVDSKSKNGKNNNVIMLDSMKIYFDKVIDEYSIEDIFDIDKYSKNMFDYLTKI